MAEESGLAAAKQALFSGAKINQTEQRAVLHTELRNPNTTNPEIKQTLAQMTAFVSEIHHSHYTDVIVLGIGGSDLGPRLVCEALAVFKITALRLHFVANVDGDTLGALLKQLDP